MRKIVTFTIPFAATYDAARSTAEAAIEDVFRALGEAEQAGFFDRTIIDFTYGGPVSVGIPDTIPDEDEGEDGQDQIAAELPGD
jgi:hypothetical protein